MHSGYARQRIGPKLLNCCRPEPMGTQEYDRMLKRIQVLEDGRSQQRMQEAGGTKEKNHKKRVSEAFGQVRNRRFHGPKRIMESR